MPHMNCFKLSYYAQILSNDLNRTIEISGNLSSLNWIFKSYLKLYFNFIFILFCKWWTKFLISEINIASPELSSLGEKDFSCAIYPGNRLKGC